MTIAELHRAIRALIPRQHTISVEVATQEGVYGLSVEFKAFVHDYQGDPCAMFSGESIDAVWEQVHARYATTPEDAMASLETDLSDLAAINAGEA